ncbi:hypothetical protein [Actinorhabdospora filicis]|nr:hypothetical protein [Actinorhabdospora filicis]
MAGYALTTVTAGAGGRLSDRFGGRRKAFVLGAAVAPLLPAIGGGENYAALFAFAALVGLAGAVLVTRIKGVH